MSNANPPGFGVMVRTLINANIVTRLGNPDWPNLASRMPGVNYESLRKAVVGERLRRRRSCSPPRRRSA
jgi:hypothetical protein